MSSRALPDERSLVERAKTDPGAFGELYDRYFHQMYRFVFSRMRDQTAAEDVTSEVFIKALKGIPRYQDTGRPFVAWLYQIAVNTVADRYRSSRPTVDIDEVRQVWAIVEKLPAPQRTAIVLKFQEDMKITDIAAVMGKTEGAVKLLIHRGMTRIRGTLVPGAAR